MDEELIFEPGFYTKVRLDDTGKIVDAANLEKEDLPSHSHSLKDIKGSLTDEIIETVSKMFIDGETAVRFIFDPKTKKITADVNVDGTSIDKNYYGQLEVIGEGSGSSGAGLSVQDLNKINTKIEKVREDIRAELTKTLANLLVNNPDSAVSFTYDPKLGIYTADVRTDGVTVDRNEFGELTATGGGSGGVSTECGNHTHQSNQITDFKDAVINIFNDFSKTISFDLNQYIDGTTIKINEQGQITAVRTALEKHKHTISEIVDYKTPDPAALQPMSDLGEEVDYKRGVIDFSKLNIGFSILALSEYINNVTNKNIENLSKRIDEINLNTDNTGACILSVAPEAISNILLDKNSGFYREVFYSKTLNLIFDFLPILQGDVVLLKNGVEVERVDVKDLNMNGDKSGHMEVSRIYRKNSFWAKVLKINVSDFVNEECDVTFQLRFEDESKEDHSNKLRLFVTPNKALDYICEDITPTHKVGANDYYYKGESRKFRILIKDFDKYRFVNNSGKFVDGIYEDLGFNGLQVCLNNLFGESFVDVSFPLKEEQSTSDLYNWQKELLFADIVNDVIIPRGEGDCSFEIPNTQNYNSLKISGVDLNLCQIQRGKLIAKGNVLAKSPRDCGRVPLSTNNYGIISFLNNYNNGKENIILHLVGPNTIDLKKIQIEAMEV